MSFEREFQGSYYSVIKNRKAHVRRTSEGVWRTTVSRLENEARKTKLDTSRSALISIYLKKFSYPK
jgi:hypothetical protein